MASMLEQVSNDFAAAVERIGPAVVRVEGRRRFPATGVIWSSEGVIVTAHHVVKRDEGISVGLADGRTANAALVGRDPSTDLAVLRAEAGDLAPASWAGDAALKVGQLALAVGRPGEALQASLGVITALEGVWRSPAGGSIERYVQADVTMYPGFSGGPLLGAAGDMIGLNTSALLRGVSLTIPAQTVRRVVEALLAHGRVRRGYLGIGSQPVRLPDALASELGQETGLLLVSVEPDSPAGRAGLLLGDTIVALAGERVRHLDDLQAILSGDRVGQTVTVRIVRGGQAQEREVTIGERA
ncbi:MAG TPA: trypsin-like peptidase domain-containing protein [Aggregatilineaceae bacterium]|nr:trypsin-like peptidase domain-containing protein [Aggregatilineaceae bacterium]